MKRIVFVFLFFNLLVLSNSEEIIKIKDIRTKIKNIDNEEKETYIEQIKNLKLEKETGYIIKIKKINENNDIVYVEMDKPNLKNLIADVFFIIDNKISARLSELQMIYFNANISNYDHTNDMIELSDIFLSGIMK